MESYRTMVDGHIQRQSDLALIPPTEENADYVRFLNDKENGAEILPFDYEAENQRQIAAALTHRAGVAKREALARLNEIDIKSIRSIREWIASQPTAPQFIKDFESQARTEREKLK